MESVKEYGLLWWELFFKYLESLWLPIALCLISYTFIKCFRMYTDKISVPVNECKKCKSDYAALINNRLNEVISEYKKSQEEKQA